MRTHRHMLRTGLIAAGLGLPAGLGFSLSATPASAQMQITTGVVSPSSTLLPEYWAADLGCAKENGYEADLVSVGAGGAQQLAAGSLHISQSGFPDYFRAIARNAPMKIFINNNSNPPYSVHAKPSIKKVADLKGKTISIGGAKDVTLIYMQPFLAAAGLKVSDVDFVYAKATGDRFTALVAGAVDATILNPPASFRADGLGFSNIGEISEAMKDYPFTVWAYNSNWAAKNKDSIVAFTKCHLRGVAWMYQPDSRAKAIELLIKYTKADPKDAASTYDYMVTKLQTFARDGMLAESTFQKMKAGLIEMGDVQEPVPPLSKFFDPAFVAAASEKRSDLR